MFRLVIGFWEFRFARVSCPRLRFREFLKDTVGTRYPVYEYS